MLSTVGPLLKRRDQNPHACLIALFLNATREVYQSTNLADQMASVQWIRMLRYFPGLHDVLHDSHGVRSNSLDSIRLLSAHDMFHDFDGLFNRFMNECRFLETTKDAKLEIKKENTIIAPWPLRLGENATAEEFNILCSSNHTGAERYVEWKRID